MWSGFRRPALTISVATAAALLTAASAGVLLSSRSQTERIARAMTGGDPDRAPGIIRRYGCSGCHTIPGIAGADGQVGGSLAEIGRRVYVGGVAPNSSDNIVRWIVSPQALSPRSAMPATGISDSEARDVAAYLYSH
jgi:cytochrome c